MSKEKKYTSLEDFGKEWKKENPVQNSTKKPFVNSSSNETVSNESVSDTKVNDDIIRIPI